jgi:hypothetical protein
MADKIGWEGLSDGTPSSDPHKDPNDQKDVTPKMDWRGQDSDTPSSNPSTDPTKGN